MAAVRRGTPILVLGVIAFFAWNQYANRDPIEAVDESRVPVDALNAPPALKPTPDREPRAAADVFVVPEPISVLDPLFMMNSIDREEFPEKYDGKVVAEFGDFVRVRRVLRNCRDTRQGFHCDTVHEFDHPYNEFGHDELASIAEFDAAASYVLAFRIFHGGDYKKYYGDAWYEAGVNYFIDSAILSGKSQPYTTMLTARGLSGIRWTNGVLLIPHIEESYVWRKAGIDLEFLPDDDPGLEHLRRFIDENRSNYPDIDTDAWDGEADDIRRMIESRKARITG